MTDFEDLMRRRKTLLAAAPRLLEAITALGALPEGYCFCSANRVGDDSKIHEPECADLRAAIAAAEGQGA